MLNLQGNVMSSIRWCTARINTKTRACDACD